MGLEFCRLLALGLDKKTWTVEETAQKKKDLKQKRKEKAAEKAAAILKGAGSAEWGVAAELRGSSKKPQPPRPRTPRTKKQQQKKPKPTA